jgi:hypothetical protein
MATEKDQAKKELLAWEAFVASGEPFGPSGGKIPSGKGGWDERIPMSEEPRAATAADRYDFLTKQRSALAALADVDFEAALANQRAMPEGEPKEAARLGLLDHARSRRKTDFIDSLVRDLLVCPHEWVAREAAKSVVQAFEPSQLEQAIQFAGSLTPVHLRLAATRAIVARWTDAASRPAIESMIRHYPAVHLRHSLALPTRPAAVTDPDPDRLSLLIDSALQRAAMTSPKASLTHALLDQRASAASPAAAPDEATRVKVEKWIRTLQPVPAAR